MKPNTSERRLRLAPLGLPAAILGALAGALVSAPADADATTAEIPNLRLATSPTRIVPLLTVPADYVVVAGDTVFAIADRFGLRTADVLAWNGLAAQSVIYPGQRLRLTAPASAAPATEAVAPPASSTTHTVVAGDTLFAIAQKNGVSVDALLSANGLDRGSIIYPGQTIDIGGSALPSPAASTAPPAAAPPAASTAANSHTVVAGDTLFAIAQKNGITVDVLLAANGLDRSSIIYPGQSLALTAPVPSGEQSAELSADLSSEQAATAGLIIRIGRELGVPDRGIAIALATGMVESGLRNLDWGDRDSLGVFQQRPSTGWGTAAQVQDADRSTRAFYGGPHDPNGATTRGLLDIPGWESMPFTDAAQTVQISAYPDRYGQWESAANRWLALYQ